MLKQLRITILLLIFTATAVCAQSHKTQITDQFTHYTNLLLAKDFDKAADYIIDDFFKLIPREQLLMVMEKTFNDPAVKFEIDSAKILRIGELQKIDEAYYAKLRYANTIRMQMKPDSTLTDSSDIASAEELVLLSLQGSFGEENVQFNPLNRTYTIYSEKDVVAKQYAGSKWKFVVVEEKQLPMLKKFIPRQIIDAP